MNDLIAFIEARLAEDEAFARQATPGPWTTNGTSVWREPSDTWDFRAHMISNRMPFVVVDVREVPERGNPRHIARHDPARVLREVEARRRTLAWHLRVKDPNAPAYDLPDQCGPCYQEWPCHDLRNLAAVWSDHPDYRAEWHPER